MNSSEKNKVVKDILNHVYGPRSTTADVITDLQIWLMQYLEPYHIQKRPRYRIFFDSSIYFDFRMLFPDQEIHLIRGVVYLRINTENELGY